MILKEFGPRLKSLRRSRNINQYELSQLLNISRQAYSNYETGRCSPSVDVLAELTVLLEFDFFSMFLEAAILKHGCNHSDFSNTNESEVFTCKVQTPSNKF